MNSEITTRTNSGFKKPPLRKAKPAGPTAREPAETKPEFRLLRGLVWAYFWLLLFEGAFRKWWLPQFSDPLLIIRDPIALWIIFLAGKHRLVPHEKLYRWLIFLAVAGVLLCVAQFILLKTPPYVLIYGYRTAFLHLPLIFLLPLILSRQDVLRFGFWVLILALPMAALMAWQFNSPADAWINKTVGTSGTLQITSAMGKIRPPGTFSFVSGCIAFFSLLTAFLGYGLVSRPQVYPKWLLACASVAVGLGVAVSGSRATLLSVGIVAAAWVFGAFAGKRISTSAANAAIVLLVAVFVLQQVPMMREGTEVLDHRIEIARLSEEEGGGLLGRILGDMIKPLQRLREVPFFGVGLGSGTNVGSVILTGEMKFLVSEGEWGRILFESGPIFGLVFLGFRLALAFQLGLGCVRAAGKQQILPILLFSACAMGIVSGQFGQPTTLGFTVFGAGLCWAALRRAEAETTVEGPFFKRVPFQKQAP